MSKTVDFLKEAKVFFVATADGAQPRVRPFGATMSYEGKVYFCTNNKKDVFKQLAENPAVEICASAEGGRWIRISGKAVVDPSDEARKAMLECNPSLNRMYSIGDGIFEVFYIDDMRSTAYSFTTEPASLED